MPGTPSSRTRMFDPWPSRRTSTPSSWHRRTSADQLLDGFRLGKVFGRTAQLKPGVHGQRLALPHDILETGQETHVRPLLEFRHSPLAVPFRLGSRLHTSPAPSVTSTSPGARRVSRIRSISSVGVAGQDLDAERGGPSGEIGRGDLPRPGIALSCPENLGHQHPSAFCRLAASSSSNRAVREAWCG